jgi:hypothetical protein
MMSECFSGEMLMTSSRTLIGTALAFVVSLPLFTGCGGTSPEVDNAVYIKPEPPKPASTPTTPAPTPTEASPSKDAPKG